VVTVQEFKIKIESTKKKGSGGKVISYLPDLQPPENTPLQVVNASNEYIILCDEYYKIIFLNIIVHTAISSYIIKSR